MLSTTLNPNLFGIGSEPREPYPQHLIENMGRRRLSHSLIILKAPPSTIPAIAQSDVEATFHLLETARSSPYQ